VTGALLVRAGADEAAAAGDETLPLSPAV